MPDSSAPFCWAPQPGPQTDAICATWCPEILYGGAAGGGKSDVLLGDYLQDVPTYGKAWQGVIFRRTYPELEELLLRSHEIFPPSGAQWHEAKHRWIWPNGAMLRMRYLERDADATRYQGHQYAWIGFDELTQWPSLYAYRYLRARLRSAHPVPTKRMRSAANPGGPGHSAVKMYFIDPAPTGYRPILDPETGMERMFIPAKLKDNKILLRSDPEYAGRLKGLGSEELVRAWLDGDWNVVQGAFFGEFATAKHVIDPRPLPKHWTRFRAMDWGFARPFSIGWYAVSDGTVEGIAKGALVRYRERYGWNGKPNAGARMTAPEVARLVAKDEAGETIAYGVADPAIFATQDGPSIAERFARSPERILWDRGDNKRVPDVGAMGGWDQVRARLRGDEDGPGLLVFSTCTHLIRTLPLMQHDQNRPEDMDTEGEDHAVDELRYACMSRPYIRDLPKGEPARSITIGGASTVTMDDVWRAQEEREQEYAE